jgi:hypothetical protein
LSRYPLDADSGAAEMTQTEQSIFDRWDELRKQGIAAKDRIDDPEINRLVAELKPIRACIERKK